MSLTADDKAWIREQIQQMKKEIEAHLLAAAWMVPKVTAAQTYSMTERQRAVLTRIVAGMSSKEIAAQLSVSESSVKHEIQQLFIKTGVRTRIQLARIAFENTPQACASTLVEQTEARVASNRE